MEEEEESQVWAAIGIPAARTTIGTTARSAGRADPATALTHVNWALHPGFGALPSRPPIRTTFGSADLPPNSVTNTALLQYEARLLVSAYRRSANVCHQYRLAAEAAPPQ